MMTAAAYAPAMRRALACALVTGLACLVGVQTAGAAHHLVKIREVYTGSSAVPGAEFVELQLTSAGENQVTSGGGSSVRLYDAAGSPTAAGTFASNPPNGDNQRTILAGCPLVEGTFGVTLDLTLACAFPTDGSGGSACFNSTAFGSLDCVSWGAATVAPAGTSSSGTPAAAIPDGQSLTRNIGSGCATLHEFADDTNVSANDFTATNPSPRPNSVASTETECPPDSDGDGIPNTLDACQNFPASTPNGCPTPTHGDGDGDGVPDATDQCPATAALGANGCPPGVDNRDPTQQVNGAKKQDVDKLSLRVSADEGATLVGTGTVKVPGPRRLWKFKTVTETVTGGQSVRLRFKLAPKALEQVRNALEDGTQKARLKVTATDPAGNTSEERRTINLTD